MIIVKPKAVFPTQTSKYEYNAQALIVELSVESLHPNTSGHVFIVIGVVP